MKLLSKLRIRLVLWTVTLEAALLLVFAVVFMGALQNSQNQQLDETLRLGAAQMNAVVDVRGSQYEVPTEDTIALRTRGVLVWILTPDGVIGATVGDAVDTPLPQPLPAANEMADVNLGSGEPIRLFTAPLQEGSRLLGTLVLAVSLRAGQSFLQQVLLSLVIALPVVLSLSAAGGLFLANRALLPVATITSTARQISAADLSQRLDLNLPDDEIGQLARTFNAMLERIDDAFQRERQLTSDVSHELRTPLGMLKTQLSLARSRPREVAELLQMMIDMEGDVDRMTRLVEQMLTLARVEQRGLSDLIPVDLGSLLRSIIGQFQASAAQSQIVLRLELPLQVNLIVNGDAEQLRQVMVNLIDNAIKYTDTAGVVTISTVRHWDKIEFAVTNSGAGIPLEHLSHLFERFYRVDSARARSSGGFGLGLAIAKAIITAHNGEIRVESEIGRGTTFTVSLPATLAKRA